VGTYYHSPEKWNDSFDDFYLMKGRIMKIMKKSNAGFTLIEVIASLVLMSIVAAVAAMGLVYGVQSYVITRTSSDAVQRAEYALNRLKLEFRSMDNVTTAGANTITFTRDATYGGAGVYTFTRAGNQINLTVAGVDNPLLTGVGTGGAFLTYRNNAGGAWVPADGFGGTYTCTSNSLHSLTVNLIITRSDGGGDLALTTSVNPRNNECANGPQAVSLVQ
jgi:prepilin-type N-terminal cleavage/methylation domain-containing protein